VLADPPFLEAIYGGLSCQAETGLSNTSTVGNVYKKQTSWLGTTTKKGLHIFGKPYNDLRAPGPETGGFCVSVLKAN